jgi:hypothetical protein
VNHIETARQQYLPGQIELPEKGGRILQQITQCALTFQRQVMAIYMDTIDNFVFTLIALACRANNRYLVAIFPECRGLLPNASIKRGGRFSTIIRTRRGLSDEVAME